jgi:FkbM family methyltransferase
MDKQPVSTRIRLMLERLTGRKILKRLPHGNDPFDDVRHVLKNKEMKTFFDVGGHFGETVRQIFETFASTHVFSFEPSAHSFEILKKNTAGFNCECHHLALGSRVGTIEVEVSDDAIHSGMNSMINRTEGKSSLRKETFLVSTIDAFCSENNVKHIDYLKIDTEGYDLEVVFGAEAMLRAGKIDFVQVEVSMNPTNAFHISGDKVKSHMEALGYVLFGLYDQTLEWITKRPMLRRTNMVFINLALAEKMRY